MNNEESVVTSALMSSMNGSTANTQPLTSSTPQQSPSIVQTAQQSPTLTTSQLVAKTAVSVATGASALEQSAVSVGQSAGGVPLRLYNVEGQLWTADGVAVRMAGGRLEVCNV